MSYVLAEPKPKSVLAKIDGRLVFRTVYPSLAREQSCVACHNQLQQGKPKWHLNDVMGAFAIDVPVASFLQDIQLQSFGVGLVALIVHLSLTWHDRTAIAPQDIGLGYVTLGFMALASTVVFYRLPAEAGAELSGR